MRSTPAPRSDGLPFVAHAATPDMFLLRTSKGLEGEVRPRSRTGQIFVGAPASAQGADRPSARPDLGEADRPHLGDRRRWPGLHAYTEVGPQRLGRGCRVSSGAALLSLDDDRRCSPEKRPGKAKTC